MKTTFITILLALMYISGSAQIFEFSHTIIKDTSKKLIISDSELNFFEENLSQIPDSDQNSDNIFFKNPNYKLLISEAELEALKNKFIPSEIKTVTPNDRKQIDPIPEAIKFYIKSWYINKS